MSDTEGDRLLVNQANKFRKLFAVRTGIKTANLDIAVSQRTEIYRADCNAAGLQDARDIWVKRCGRKQRIDTLRVFCTDIVCKIVIRSVKFCTAWGQKLL